jgi:hypothetical protein
LDAIQHPVVSKVEEDITARTPYSKRWRTDNHDSKNQSNQIFSYTEIRPGLHVPTSGSEFKDADPTLTTTTAEGRVSTFRVEEDAAGSTLRTNTDPSGLDS